MESSLLSKRENAGCFFDAGKRLAHELYFGTLCFDMVVIESVCHF